MLKQPLAILTATFLLGATALAQQTQSAPKNQPRKEQPAKEETKTAPQPRPEPAQPINTQIEITITDQPGPEQPSKKLVTMVVADRQNASIRTSGWVVTKDGGRREVNINVDARPVLLRSREGSIQLDLLLQYQPSGTAGSESSAQTGLNERISSILESGKSLVVSQSADPLSDRRITVEVKATILK
jgi:glucose/arabinose dehydrogenase